METRSQARKRKEEADETPAGSRTNLSAGSQTNLCLKWILVIVAFVFFGGCVVATWSILPNEGEVEFQLPSGLPQIQDAKNLAKYLNQYTDSNMPRVVVVYLITYIFLQTFAIPGSIFLSLMAGSLFPTPLALLLVCCAAAVGASCANCLSAYVGTELVERHFSERLAKLRTQVGEQRGNMFNYMLFLRITPLVPNFLVNICSPHVNVPISTFFWGTFFGVAPPSLLFVRAGRTLHTLADTNVVPKSEMALLVVLGIVSLLPALGKEWLSQKLLGKPIGDVKKDDKKE